MPVPSATRGSEDINAGGCLYFRPPRERLAIRARGYLSFRPRAGAWISMRADACTFGHCAGVVEDAAFDRRCYSREGADVGERVAVDQDEVGVFSCSERAARFFFP